MNKNENLTALIDKAIAGDRFLRVKPFNNFLNRVLDGFTMPAR